MEGGGGDDDDDKARYLVYIEERGRQASLRQGTKVVRDYRKR